MVRNKDLGLDTQYTVVFCIDVHVFTVSVKVRPSDGSQLDYEQDFIVVCFTMEYLRFVSGWMV